MLWLLLCLHRPWPACTSLARVGLHTITLQQSPPPHALQAAARWPWSGHSGHPRDPRLWCHTVLWDMVTVSAAAQAEPSRGKPACIACGPYSLHGYSLLARCWSALSWAWSVASCTIPWQKSVATPIGDFQPHGYCRKILPFDAFVVV